VAVHSGPAVSRECRMTGPSPRQLVREQRLDHEAGVQRELVGQHELLVLDRGDFWGRSTHACGAHCCLPGAVHVPRDAGFETQLGGRPFQGGPRDRGFPPPHHSGPQATTPGNHPAWGLAARRPRPGNTCLNGIDGRPWGVHAAFTTAARSFGERTAPSLRRVGGEEREGKQGRGNGEAPPDLSSPIGPARRRGQQRQAQYRRAARGRPEQAHAAASHRLAVGRTGFSSLLGRRSNGPRLKPLSEPSGLQGVAAPRSRRPLLGRFSWTW
jgi:hypothetical protein